MKSHEMREMTLDELQQHHDTLIEELANSRIKLAMKQLDNTDQVRLVRKEIARAKTILQEKVLGAQPGETLADVRKKSKTQEQS